MCGRFTLTVEATELQQAFPGYTFPAQFKPRFNICPGQPVLAVLNTPALTVDSLVWGLIPAWAKDPQIGSRLINARAETLAEKPSFRGAYRYKRCLIFADGFYEWQIRPESKFKVPHYIRLKSGQPFTFAGLWEEWHASDGSLVKSCTIITTEPNALMSAIHNRMPVILPPAAHQQWLDPTPQTPQSLQPLLLPYPSEEMMAYPVSTLVNKPENDRPELIHPA
ncbi:MAG: hypothetical protein DDG60_01445 [Anaerolineae bacterium]|nr:MAG: hypothetical protein DDG60_01445 [Anaerolineae bacterium]